MTAWGAAGFRTTGDVVWFPRCPARYITAFTTSMLSWYLWLNEWGKTPLDFGASPAQLDPRYAPAMEVLRREMARIEREELERIKQEHGR